MLARHAVSLFSGRGRGMVRCVPAVYQLCPPSVLQVVLAHPLGRQLCQDVVQVIGVGVAVASQVGTEFCLVVDLVPHHCVRLTCGAGRADGEDEASVPGHDQQLQDLQTHTQEMKGHNTTHMHIIDQFK